MSDVGTTTGVSIASETAISMVINAAISAGVFYLLFGLREPAAVAGVQGYAADFVPQTFMVALMGSLVPALLTAGRAGTMRKVRFGRIEGVKAIALRSLAVALAAAIVLGGGIAVLLTFSGLSTVPAGIALFTKVVFGAAVALVLTPAALRHVLR